MIFHPSFHVISAYADRDLSRRRRAQVAAHLRRCVTCRRSLRDVRDLAEQAAAIDPPGPASSALSRILARRARGERVILPLSDPLPERRARVPLGAIAAGLAAVAVSIALLQARPPEGELRFVPAAPDIGEPLAVQFRSAPGMSQLDRVFLRARYRTRRDTVVGPDVPEITVAELRREDAGLFRGRVVLPDSSVFAVFVIEDGRGRRLDGPGSGWELLTYARGTPRYDAFVQQQRHRLPNVSAAIESARRAMAVYPQRPDARRRVQWLENMAASQRQRELAAQADRLPLLSR